MRTTTTRGDSVTVAIWRRSRRPGSHFRLDGTSAHQRARRMRLRSRKRSRRSSTNSPPRWSITSGWLVPCGGRSGAWAMRSKSVVTWSRRSVGALSINFDRHRVPLSSTQRESRRGSYPYWGANGPIDSIEDYIFEGPHILIAEDGNTVVRADGRATVHWADGRFWVNNHAHVLKSSEGVNQRWLYYALSQVDVR